MQKMHLYVAALLLFGTPVAALAMAPMLAGRMLTSWFGSILTRIERLIPKRAFDTIDETAYECGSPA
jgi:NADH:ubiquinone oxidoreductase subunit 3 (subunit A)